MVGSKHMTSLDNDIYDGFFQWMSVVMVSVMGQATLVASCLFALTEH